MSTNSKKKKNTKKFNTKKPAVEKKVTPNVPSEWLLLCKQEIDVTDIQAAIDGIEKVDTEVWKEMGVLEISVSEEAHIDVEELECEAEDDEALEKMMQEIPCKALFAVTIKPDDYEVVVPVMKKIIEKLDAIIVADNDTLEELK